MLIQLQQIECYWPKNVRSHLKDKYLRLVIIQLINIYTTYVHRKPKQTNVQVHKIKKTPLGKESCESKLSEIKKNNAQLENTSNARKI